MDFDCILRNEGFQNSKQSHGKIETSTLLVSGQVVIKL